MEIEELIETLQELAEEYPRSEVRLAQQPTWSFEYSIGSIVASCEKEDDRQEWEEDSCGGESWRQSDNSEVWCYQDQIGWRRVPDSTGGRYPGSCRLVPVSAILLG